MPFIWIHIEFCTSVSFVLRLELRDGNRVKFILPDQWNIILNVALRVELHQILRN
jgi:hypothetical protein